jgi:hypothetical protein
MSGADDKGARPTGQRYSHVYLDRPVNIRDSARIRKRVVTLFLRLKHPDNTEEFRLAQYLEEKTGEDIPFVNNYNWWDFFERKPLDTFLDSITLIFEYWVKHPHSEAWRKGCEEIFREERAAYFVDDRGGVHDRVDQAFQANRALAIEALRGVRYATAAQLLENAYSSLDGAKPQARDAIRNAFDAVETLFKLMTGMTKIGNSEVQKLKPMISRLYASDSTATSTSLRLLGALVEWVEASHPYCHGPGATGGAEPPEELWQALISQAASHIRWLASLDRAMLAHPPKDRG